MGTPAEVALAEEQIEDVLRLLRAAHNYLGAAEIRGVSFQIDEARELRRALTAVLRWMWE